MTPMCKMTKTILLLSGALLMAAPARVAAQSFDTSGTASLSGTYLFRYVNFFNDGTGNLVESCSLTGVMTFDGKGNYALSNTQLFDSAGTGGTGDCTSPGVGTYGVQSNGIAQLDNPLFPATLFGTFSQPVLTASSTEDFNATVESAYFDLFIAVQAPTVSSSNGILSGAYTVGTLDFLDASVSLARQGFFTINADGNGHIAAFTVTGSLVNLGAGDITQNVSSSTYALSGAAGGTVTFPGSSSDQTQIVAGAKVLYVSADGNWFVAGSATGSDMFFGFRAPSGTSSDSLLNGTYFMAGMDANPSSPVPLDAFYGSINTNGNGTLIWHERFDDIVDVSTYDYTTDFPVTIGGNGSYFDGYSCYYLAGANGQAVMLIGSNQNTPQFSLNIGIHAPSVTPTSAVWISPIGITNAANYPPITNAYAPGELVTLFGNFGASTQSAPSLPIPTTLGGVQVSVNGHAAPLLYVSSGQINAQIPYEISGDYFATFQVAVNGSKSNTVTVYADNSAPGLFTIPANGISSGAIEHWPSNALVTDSNPAVPGETVQLFMNGLGTVTPPVADGAAASSNPLSYSDEYENSTTLPCASGGSWTCVYLDDGSGNFPLANVLFAGLAPGFAGLYQVNFTLPAAGTLASGDDFIYFETNEGSNEMATIALSGFSGAVAPFSPDRRASRPQSRAVRAKATHARKVNHRRALPERPVGQDSSPAAGVHAGLSVHRTW